MMVSRKMKKIQEVMGLIWFEHNNTWDIMTKKDNGHCFNFIGDSPVNTSHLFHKKRLDFNQKKKKRTVLLAEIWVRLAF